MCPSASQWVAPCTHRLSVSSAYLILFQSCRPAMASVPVASIWWIGLNRPPNRPVCGPLLSSGMPSANTLPVRIRRAALTISSGLTWLSVPIWSSLPQRPQFLSFCVASAIACLPTLMSIGCFLITVDRYVEFASGTLGQRSLNFEPDFSIMIASEVDMAQVIVRNLDDAVKRRLQRRAARHGHSMEEELRDILRDAVKDEDRDRGGFGTEAAKLFRGIGLEEP